MKFSSLGVRLCLVLRVEKDPRLLRETGDESQLKKPQGRLGYQETWTFFHQLAKRGYEYRHTQQAHTQIWYDNFVNWVLDMSQNTDVQSLGQVLITPIHSGRGFIFLVTSDYMASFNIPKLSSPKLGRQYMHTFFKGRSPSKLASKSIHYKLASYICDVSPAG